MLLIAQTAWLRRVSTPPQLGGPMPVALVTIEPDVSSASTTYGFSGSPARASGIGAIASMASASHAQSFPMAVILWVPVEKGNLGSGPTSAHRGRASSDRPTTLRARI